MGGLAGGLQSLGSIADLFGGIMSGISGQQALDWLHGAYTNNLNFGRGQYESLLNQFNNAYNPARDQALGAGDRFSQMVNGALGPYMDNAAGLSGQIPGLLQQYGGSQTNDQISGASSGLSDILGGANSIFGDRGWTPQNYALFDQGQSMANGQNDPMRAFSNIGQNLLNSGGETNFNRGVQDRSLDAVNSGGMTDLLNSARAGAQGIQAQGGATDYSQAGIGQALQMLLNGGATSGTNALDAAGANALNGNLGVAGLTNTGAVGELEALKGIQGGGQTALSSALQQKALEILKTNPTISIEKAVSMARDAAASAAGQQGRTARARALARGGGPGTVVGAGSQNEAMTDFADQAMQAEAAAGRDAMLKQQGVLTDYAKTGASLGLGAGDLNKGTLGTYSDLLKGLEGVAASRFGTGGDLLGKGTSLATDRAQTGLSGLTSLGGLETNRLLSALGLQPTIQNSATSNAGTLGNLGLGAAADQNSRLNTGSDMLQKWLTDSLAGSNLSAGANTSAQNYGLGAGELGRSSAQALGSLGATSAGLGQSQFQNLFNAMNQGLTQQGNALGTAIGGQKDLSINPLLQLANQVGNMTNTFGNNTSGLPGISGTNNSWNALAAGGK